MRSGHLNFNRFYRFIFITLIIFSMTAGLSGCNNENGGGGPSATSGNKGKLYIANAGTGTLVTFDNAATIDGNLFPSSRYPETITGPTGLALDEITDTLYVANSGHNAILIYDNVSTLQPPLGFAAAGRIIAGPKTELNNPSALAYDSVKKELYVANKDGNAIVVFNKNCPQTNNLSGNISPCRILSGSSTLLNAPQALAIDSAKNILYIANSGTNTVLAYANASTAQGNLPPSQTLSGPSTLLNDARALSIDIQKDILYISNKGSNSVLVYPNASQAGGDLPPNRTIGLSQSPNGLFIDAENDRLYLAAEGGSDSAALIYENASLKSGAVSPDRTLRGNKTKLSTPTGLAVDPGRDALYISNTGANQVLAFAMAIDGNTPPAQTNPGSATLRLPTSFFYDKASDRLYVANAGRDPCSASNPCIAVYEQISKRTFDGADPRGTAPDWTFSDNNNISVVRGIFLYRPDKTDPTKDRLIVMSALNRKLLVYTPPTPPSPATGQNVPLTPLTNVDLGLPNVPLSTMTVDEGRGAVYIAWSATGTTTINTVIKKFEFDSNANTGTITRTLSGPATRLNQPAGTHFGLFIDSTKDILYVTNTGDNTILRFNSASTRGGTPDNTLPSALPALCTDGPAICNTPPDRILTSPSSAPLDERLDKPIAPFVDTAADRLYLINQGKNGIFVFDRISTRTGEIVPDRSLTGGETGLNACVITFNNAFSSTGALFVNTGQGKEAFYVGQPRTIGQGCSTFTPPSDGSLLIFRNEGNIPPGTTLSGGGTAFSGPSSIAIDTTKEKLYAANQGNMTETDDDSISIFTRSGEVIGSDLLTGTVEVTKNSPIVTGTGTAFTTELNAGDEITIGVLTATVSFIASDSSLTLVSPFSGEGNSGVTLSKAIQTLCSPVASSPCPDTKLNNPSGLFIDPAIPPDDPGRLYVLNGGTSCSNDSVLKRKIPCNALLLFSSLDHLTRNAIPDLVLTSPALNHPNGLVVVTGNENRKDAYIANTGGNSILLFKDLAQHTKSRTGTETVTADNVVPDAEIIGGATGINAPVGVAYDPERDLLYVLNQGTPGVLVPEVLVFERAVTLNGNVTPTRVITGEGFMKMASALFLDVQNDLLYVADRGENAVYIFPDASQAQGDAAHRTLQGNNTALDQPAALVVDTTR